MTTPRTIARSSHTLRAALRNPGELGAPCDCPACNPPREPWWQQWAAIVPVSLVAAVVIVATWTGRLFG